MSAGFHGVNAHMAEPIRFTPPTHEDIMAPATPDLPFEPTLVEPCCGPGEACTSPTCTGTPRVEAAEGFDLAQDITGDAVIPSHELETESSALADADAVDLASPPDIGGGEACIPFDDTDAEEIPEDAPVTAAKVCAHIEAAPDYVALPDGLLPVGTDIHVEQKGTFVFKLPGQPAAIGRGRTIYGAMLNAGIVK